MNHSQDWNTVTWNKPKPKTANAAVQRGYQVSTIQRINPNTVSKNKIDKKEIDTLPKVPKAFGQAMQKARLSKKLTQKQLAQQINVKPQTINQYESGRAIKDPAIISKIRNALQIKGKFT
tara:strand:+ start:364 stop:723 length:360 start_codon:yes stop_codon:yes gene_type:complete